ncbi:MAG: AbrB/MazE/SpoVT family DNA-binding domain-containing protein [Chthoniobacterales bacterium]|nr:AbrB/MazE/SpoVT family DNA-binding domain-containing protein [Chthoniobacterales bacterium]
MRLTTTITSKGQITIPVRIREKLQLRPGHVLEFDESAPYLKAYRRIDPEEARSVIGCAKKAMKGMTAEKWLSQTRGRRVRLGK